MSLRRPLSVQEGVRHPLTALIMRLGEASWVVPDATTGERRRLVAAILAR